MLTHTFYVGSTLYHDAHADTNSALSVLMDIARIDPVHITTERISGVWDDLEEDTVRYTLTGLTDDMANMAAYTIAHITHNISVLVIRDRVESDDAPFHNKRRYGLTREPATTGNRTFDHDGNAYRYQCDYHGNRIGWLINRLGGELSQVA